ncbi:tyrosine-protein phosphatase [Collinsella intestinalis]|uniref:tyrosine-protein phosphatase n=1 Tax=Collinsella intestinalis TaxID=147207 RepID=UPI00195DAA47|nr:tyrosine-protein phosphatase [Collinsella intestinalis]MBM6908165.1 tyrosine-protein phosphatase [Collinsella intestinalis]
MSAPAHTSEPLPLRGAHNVRDLGGYSYVASDGVRGVTASHVYLRSGSLTRLTHHDRAVLRAYGLTRVIDVRSNLELKVFPDPYRRRPEPGVDYLHIPMMDQLNSNGFQGLLPESMFAVYRDLLDDGQPGFRALVGALDTAPGCTLFHCRVGKDRTGVIAMLLLDLAGVSEAEIVADYAVSERYMGGFLRLQRVGASILTRRIVPKCLFEAAPHEMERTYAYLYERYGGARRYLTEAVGCQPVAVERLARRLQGRP